MVQIWIVLHPKKQINKNVHCQGIKVLVGLCTIKPRLLCKETFIIVNIQL